MKFSPALHQLMTPYVVLPAFLMAQPAPPKKITPFVMVDRAIGQQTAVSKVYVPPVNFLPNPKKPGARAANTYRCNARPQILAERKAAKKAARAAARMAA